MAWREVVDWPQYEVSDDGRVRNLRTNRPVSVFMGNRGYWMVNLWRDGKQRLHLVHRLMAAAFLGLPDGMTVNHKDGGRANNALANLEVVTQADNNWHKTRVLRRGIGEQAGGAKLTADKVREIRRLCDLGAVQGDVAHQFSVCQSHVSRIKNRNIWRHI